MDIGNDIELYESDRDVINGVVQKLAAKIGQHQSAESWTREITERFAEAGYVVDMILGRRIEAGVSVWYPKVRIIGRTEPQGEYDYERQAHEVQAKEGVTLRDTGSNLWVPGH